MQKTDWLLVLCLWAAGLGAQNARGIDTQDPAVAYNEACRLSLAGRTREAVTTLDQAFALGFADHRYALADPDLAALRSDPDFQQLIGLQQAILSALSAERAIPLDSGAWSAAVPLEPTAGAGPGAGQPRLRLRWSPEGLDFELNLQGEFARWPTAKTPPPWRGGPGMVLTLGIPDTISTFESRAHFIFAFGLEKSSPVGAMYGGRLGWQRVLQLDPELELDEEKPEIVLRGSIPWQSLDPLHPLVDPEIGVNAAVRSFGPGFDLRAELLPDPQAFVPEAEIRRFVPLEFNLSSQSQEALAGRVNSTLSTGTPLKLSLGAFSATGGQGILSVDYTDNQGQSLLPSGPAISSVQLDQGFNQLEQEADFSRLTAGFYVAKVGLEFPSGQQSTWSTRVLHLGPSWEQGFADRVNALPLLQAPTGKFYLKTITQAVAGHFPRMNPGPIATTLGDLDRILTRADQTGTILPDSGTMLLVYPGPKKQERLCTIYLPEGYQSRGELEPVVVLSSSRGLEPRMVQRMARAYEFEGLLDEKDRSAGHSPIYILPHIPPLTGRVQQRALDEAEACLEWTRSLFEVEKLALCGVDFHGGTVLRLAQQPDQSLLGLLVMAGGNLEPWPLATADFLAAELAAGPRDVPVTWLDFQQETARGGQGPALLQTLKQLRYDIQVEQTITGGLSLTQVADRVVLWAESFP